ncbi:MAG: PHP domain-containing protein [Candidatus Latescibacteria bacterium]|nr:PHP domain-containing protein [Candidatus Latescibacterota bacterium]
MRYNLADLHLHTFCSDGLRTPTQAVEDACQAGLKAISLTDHDTVEGIDEAIEAGTRLKLEIVPGAELSAHISRREVHILAYCLDWKAPQLLAHLLLLVEQRRQRGTLIVERLNGLGLELSLEDVLKETSGGPLGRPHVAAAMVNRGLVANKDEAFSRYLGDRSPAFQPKPYIGAAEVIDLIHQVGGVAVLAHPGTSVSENLIAQLVDVGLDGLEVYHPAHRPQQIEYYMQLAQRYGLLQSGGSDSHGGPEGTRIGDYGIGYEAIEALRERAATYA